MQEESYIIMVEELIAKVIREFSRNNYNFAIIFSFNLHTLKKIIARLWWGQD